MQLRRLLLVCLEETGESCLSWRLCIFGSRILLYFDFTRTCSPQYTWNIFFNVRNSYREQHISSSQGRRSDKSGAEDQNGGGRDWQELVGPAVKYRDGMGGPRGQHRTSPPPT